MGLPWKDMLEASTTSAISGISNKSSAGEKVTLDFAKDE
jgi:hypothetical protein